VAVGLGENPRPRNGFKTKNNSRSFLVFSVDSDSLLTPRSPFHTFKRIIASPSDKCVWQQMPTRGLVPAPSPSHAILPAFSLPLVVLSKISMCPYHMRLLTLFIPWKNFFSIQPCIDRYKRTPPHPTLPLAKTGPQNNKPRQLQLQLLRKTPHPNR
jgi:hypothetical protein